MKTIGGTAKRASYTSGVKQNLSRLHSANYDFVHILLNFYYKIGYIASRKSVKYWFFTRYHVWSNQASTFGKFKRCKK